MLKEPELIQSSFQTLLEKTVEGNKHLRSALLLLHSDRHDFHYPYAYGCTNNGAQPLTIEHSYHIASIGKAFTATLIAKLVEMGKLSYSDLIHHYIPTELLKGLHIYKGVDYSKQITVHHLLNHSSGIADYYEEKPTQGKAIQTLLMEEPERFWTPQETIQFSNRYLHAHFPPGKKFYYTDTGYQLLGLIIEKLTDRPMHESLHEWIFNPLDMTHSYQLFYSQPQEASPFPLSDLYLDKTEVSRFKSVSLDWAGGGIVSTTSDLLKFHRALVNGQLLSQDTLSQMQNWIRMQWGIDYAYGLVKLKFKNFFFLLPRKLDAWGNFGSTASFMFYNPAIDTYVIGAFNQSRYVTGQVGFMIKCFSKLYKAIQDD